MFVINPGSGPVVNANEAHAIENILRFVMDVGEEVNGWVRVPDRDHDGRFGFILWGPMWNNHFAMIDMPGLPLSQVRFMKEAGQNIWDFPRLYVNESSWVWCFAIARCRKELSEQTETGNGE